MRTEPDTSADTPSRSLHTVEPTAADLEDAVAGAVTVFHLAVVPRYVAPVARGIGDYVMSNVVATRRLVACERSGVRRLVYGSWSRVCAAPRPRRAAKPIQPWGIVRQI